MLSGTAAGAVKPRTLVALEVIGVDCLRAGDFHDVQGNLTSPQYRTNTRLQPLSASMHALRSKRGAQKDIAHHLTRESIHEGSSPSLSIINQGLMRPALLRPRHFDGFFAANML
jgi:hypothetical protein